MRPGHVIVAAMLLGVAGCATVGRVKDAVTGDKGITVTLRADPNLNTTSAGAVLGVVKVRAYLLRDPGVAATATYEELWIARALDAAALARDEAELLSSETRELKLVAEKGHEKEGRVVVLVAGYHSPDRDQGWRQIVPIAAAQHAVSVRLGPRGMDSARAK